MRCWGWVLASLLCVACTKPNAAKHCTEGTCTTPAFPFCDVTGAIGGEEGTCIAVTCAAGEFGECRGDAEVRCNTAGTNYDVVQCERGCDRSADGCRLCNPGETACTNGTVATCDANGAVISSTVCPLGCFEAEPRCREIAPSNSLATFLDMVTDPPDLDLEDASFNTSTGVVTDLITNTPIIVPSFAVAAPAGGTSIRVFVANNVRITRASVASDGYTGAAFALLARGDIRIVGLLQVKPTAGGLITPGCRGGQGRLRNGTCGSSGGGGGAFATNGANGGGIPGNSEPGGAGGIASGNDKLVPLRGGCDGGGVDDDNGDIGFARAGVGGGAVQLVSRQTIVVEGIISAVGGDGDSDRYDQTNLGLEGGGGAGGGILIEAPQVELASNAQLLAYGGNGAWCAVNDLVCSLGGQGAKVGIAATAGADTTCTTAMPAAAGAGGGGLGRIRINTRTGTYTKASSAVEQAVVTSGMVATR